jgi:hypothetical protein
VVVDKTQFVFLGKRNRVLLDLVVMVVVVVVGLLMRGGDPDPAACASPRRAGPRRAGPRRAGPKEMAARTKKVKLLPEVTARDSTIASSERTMMVRQHHA